MTTELAYTYNDFGLPVKLTYTDVDGETRTVREETNLTYDGNGNILTEAVTEAYSGSTTKTRTYQYDLGNRLISAAYDGTTTTYTYDAVGNRLTRQEGTETAETYTYNYLNQLTRVQQGTAVTTYTYDARGNQTQQVQTGTGVTTTSTYGYDLANRLISTSVSNNAVIPLSTSATYAYNAQGQRVTRVEDEVITHFYYTGSALLFTTVNEYVLQTQNILDPSGTIVASKRFEGQAETEQDPYADDYFFYRHDIRGSVTNIVDGAGSVVKSYDYDEFGVTTSTGDTFFNEVTFTGSVADASGLLYMNARYYNPTTARFLSQDTYTGSASIPWTQHLYAYCNNNPVNMVDPTGHAAEAIAVGAGLCLIAAIIVAADIIINGTGTQLQESISKAIDDAADSVNKRLKNDALITSAIFATASLLARAVANKVTDAIQDTFKEKPQTVYVLLNDAQQIVYVGRTVNPKRREYEHIYKKDARHADTTFHTVASNLTYMEARGLEQQLFVENYSSILRNKIAGISRRNPNYMDYMRAATEINVDRYENWWYIFTGR